MTTEEDEEEEEVDLTSVRSRARLLEGGAGRPGVNIFAARLNYKCIYVSTIKEVIKRLDLDYQS